MKQYDVIVVGGGHAGIEAAYISSKFNLNVLLISLSINKIGLTPCNPSIGGSAKGIVVREIDALGGLIAKISDTCTLQIKHLNKSKGYAVRSIRSQIDKVLYPQNALKFLCQQKNIEIIEDKVKKLIFKNNNCLGVMTHKNGEILGKKTILTTGTYMSSLILKGDERRVEGPEKQETSASITEQLKSLGVKFIRLKTGTPPRLDANTIKYDVCKTEFGDRNKNLCFSFWNKKIKNKMLPCWLTYTNNRTHQLIKENMSYSPMFSGDQVGKGPRYCPSIEDKIHRFSDKERHQLFLEPESLKTNSIYLQGFSTSFPDHIQEKIVRTVVGLENVKFLKYGYAIEYDCIIPNQLKETLELRKLSNLFSAGQVNGTSGYEEAAAQGLIAGINASLKINGKKPFILKRSESYIGVMINDLIYKKYLEPYRLLSSLSEYRLLLRSDNADERLSKYAIKYNLLSKKEIITYETKIRSINEIKKIMNHKILINNYIDLKNYLSKFNVNINKSLSLSYIFKLSNVDFKQIYIKYPPIQKYCLDLVEAVFIREKYHGYINIQEKEITKLNKNFTKKIPNDIDYAQITNLANETIEKLTFYKPKSIGDASYIQGIRPNDLLNISYYLKFKYNK